MADFGCRSGHSGSDRRQAFPGSEEFRIINKNGLQPHQRSVMNDGEAYGGTMKDFLDAVLAQYGPAWTYQSGRCRTRSDAFDPRLSWPHRAGVVQGTSCLPISLVARVFVAPGELSPFLLQALASRNFKIDGGASRHVLDVQYRIR